MIWDPFYECMDREERAELQVRRLRETVARVKANVPWYRERLNEKGIEPEDITSLDDLRHLPFTTKTDLRDNYPFGLFAIPRRSACAFTHHRAPPASPSSRATHGKT